MCFDLDLDCLHDVMAACDMCSLGYFQVIAKFCNNDTKSLSFYDLVVFYLLKYIALLNVLIVRISVIGAAENQLFFLKLRSGGIVNFLFPILKEHSRKSCIYYYYYFF